MTRVTILISFINFSLTSVELYVATLISHRRVLCSHEVVLSILEGLQHEEVQVEIETSVLPQVGQSGSDRFGFISRLLLHTLLNLSASARWMVLQGASCLWNLNSSAHHSWIGVHRNIVSRSNGTTNRLLTLANCLLAALGTLEIQIVSKSCSHLSN